ncbi:MAG: hypothetical protein U1E25_09835 [Methylocystis sp.]
MKDEYDFSEGERGKFFRRELEFSPAVHLEREVREFLLSRAEAKGHSLDEIVNEMLKEDIRRIKAAS